MDHHPKPRTAYCDCICQLLGAEFCRKLAFRGHSPAVRYSEVILPVGCARSALGCSSAKRSRSRLGGSVTLLTIVSAPISSKPVSGQSMELDSLVVPSACSVNCRRCISIALLSGYSHFEFSDLIRLWTVSGMEPSGRAGTFHVSSSPVIS
jgi:hypothetical protein